MVEAAPLYVASGDVFSLSDEWNFVPSDGGGWNPAEGYYPDKGGRWLGPLVPVAANCFLGLDFTLRARERVHWGATFFDAAEAPRIADNYGHHYGHGWQTLRRVLYAESPARFIQPFFQAKGPFELRDLSIRKLDDRAAHAYVADLQDALPPLDFAAPDLRPQLPRSFDALDSGLPWTVVLLGDSIVNDTYNSCFPALLRRHYPKMDWRIICSVRGGTGCWFYRGAEEFQSFVADYRPDLLVIGGISHQHNLVALREVAERACDELDAEILLLSGPMSYDTRKMEPEENPNPNRPPDPLAGLPAQEPGPQLAYYRDLAAYAATRDFAFGDMERGWAEYLAASRVPRGFLHRDPIHANEHGKAVLGRMLARLFGCP